MIWLQSKDEFNIVATFDNGNNMLCKYSKRNLTDKILKEMDGFFSEMGMTIFILYKEDNNLYFYVNEKTVELNEQTKIYVSGIPKTRLLEIYIGGIKIFSIKYSLTNSNVCQDDLTPFIEDEDFDFGLFVSNISRTRDRRIVMLENLGLN